MLAKLLRVPVLCGLLILASRAEASSFTGEIYPLSKVRRGQKGHGLTTMKGTTPERFEFEVIGVNRNFLPKMDIILVKSEDPKLAVTGFWQGMSGSPMWIDGKLACAFSYGFRFNKLAIGGCTPLQYMIDEGLQERRGAWNLKSRKTGKPLSYRKEKRARTPFQSWLKHAPEAEGWKGSEGSVARLMKRDRARTPWILRDTLPKRATPVDKERGMEPSAVPLALSGFSGSAFAMAKDLLADFPLQPMQAGGTGDSKAGPTEFQMGSSVAVQLVRGDMSAAATGTVSYVDGDDILAFGHPMFHAGEIYAPAAASEVHTVIPSAQIGFVVASPLRELGALTQDRQSGIALNTGLKVDMIPMHIAVKDKQGKSIGEFNVEILDSRFFTATFAAIAASNATELYLPDRDHVTLRMNSRVEIEGHPALEFEDFLHSSRGADGLLTQARALRAISPLMNNPFERAIIRSIDLEVEVGWKADVVEIVGLSSTRKRLVPGARNAIDVRIKPHHAEEQTKRIYFDVPAALEGSIVQVEVTSGDNSGLYRAPPENLSELIAAFGSLLPGTVYALTITSAHEAAAVDGRLIEDLPSSALNRLRASSRTPKLTTKRAQVRTVVPAKQVVDGEASILLKVGTLSE